MSGLVALYKSNTFTFTMHQTVDLTDLKEAVKMTKKEEIDAFLFKIIHG